MWRAEERSGGRWAHGTKHIGFELEIEVQCNGCKCKRDMIDQAFIFHTRTWQVLNFQGYLLIVRSVVISFAQNRFGCGKNCMVECVCSGYILREKTYQTSISKVFSSHLATKAKIRVTSIHLKKWWQCLSTTLQSSHLPKSQSSCLDCLGVSGRFGHLLGNRWCNSGQWTKD